MLFRFILVQLIFLVVNTSLFAQDPIIISGPFQGSTTNHSTEIWMMVKNTETISLSIDGEANVSFSNFYINDSLLISKGKLNDVILGGDNTVVLELSNQNRVTRIPFELKIPKKEINDFSFLAGSCIWPHQKKNKKWKIFDVMSKVSPDFMMWMGDNIYLLRGDWKEKESINNQYVKYRKHPKLNAFLKNQPNFSAWDDHDYGPNNADGSFYNKEMTLQAFKDFWVNPSYGTDSLEGTFYSFEWKDADFFVLDGRYYKTTKNLYGDAQLNWLKKGVLESDAKVKFIIGGCQFLVKSGGEDWSDHPNEKEDFLAFLKYNKIEGVVFLSGDRHYGELSILDDGIHPKIIEITTSPLTSFPNPFSSNQLKLRKKGTLVKKSNFARISLEGEDDSRILKIQMLGRKGKVFWEYEIMVDELK